MASKTWHINKKDYYQIEPNKNQCLNASNQKATISKVQKIERKFSLFLFDKSDIMKYYLYTII